MARRSIAPPPTRFGAPAGRRPAAVALPKSSPLGAALAKPAIPPPPTRFGAAPVPKPMPALQPKAGSTPAPPPTRFGAASAQPAQAKTWGAARAAGARPAPASAVLQPSSQYGGSGGYGYHGGYGNYYVPYYFDLTTANIEKALQQGNDDVLTFDRYGGYNNWNSKNFQGFNIEFYAWCNGVQLKVHLKWHTADWFGTDPYAMSLKFMDNSTLENPTQQYHPALWRLLLYEGRKNMANVWGWHLLGQFGGRIQRTDIQQLITAGDRQALYALYNSDHTPLSVWDSDAWSLMLDWVTR